jgi:hypothetical protein
MMLGLILADGDAQAEDLEDRPLRELAQRNGPICRPRPNGQRHGLFEPLSAGSFDILICHGACLSSAPMPNRLGTWYLGPIAADWDVSPEIYLAKFIWRDLFGARDRGARESAGNLHRHDQARSPS